MGRSRRPVPQRLASKLLDIRERLGVTQQQLFDLLGDTGTRLYVRHIGDYENGKREPPLQVLLRYARVARVPMEVLADDDLELPSYPVRRRVNRR